MKPLQLLASTISRSSNITASPVASSDGQCQWYDAPVTRRSRPRLYEPVHLLARHWVLSGRQFSLAHIAHVLLDNATTLLVSTHTHTHLFNGPLSGTTWVSRYQEGQTNPDFTGARDSEWQ